MKNKYLIVLIALLFGGICNAGELGVGKEHEGPDAAPEEPTDTESTSESLWQEVAEWFEAADSE